MRQIQHIVPDFASNVYFFAILVYVHYIYTEK